MQVDDVAAGHKTQCPSCWSILPVPNSVGASGYDGSPEGDHAFDRGGGDRRGEEKRGEGKGVMLSPLANPYAVPASLGSQGQIGHPIAGGGESYVWQYTVNGIVFMLVGLFYLVSFVGAIIQLVLALTFDAQANSQPVRLLPAILGFVITLPVSVVYLLGGLSMVRQKSLVMARAVAILATIPPLNLCVLFPFGIWSTVLTFSGRARNDFR